MCDMEMKEHRTGAARLPMVSPSDLCYLVALFYCYEKPIDWYARRASGELEVFPVGHQWKAGEPEPSSQEAKTAAIGEAYWTENLEGGKSIRHYYEKIPDPVVSVFEVSFVILKLKAFFDQANF